MSAERSTDSIIDLLYGELSEEEATQMRAELAESAELRAEYDELDTMLGRVRETMPVVEVSPSIHNAIMEAARAGVDTGIDERIMRRTPESRGFWSRVSGGQGSQIALVAAVLIAGLFVVKFVESPSSPLHAPAADISAMQEAAPAPRAPAALAKQEESPGDAPEPVVGAGGNAVADQWSAADGEAQAAADEIAPAEAVEPDPDVERSLRKELAATADRRASKSEAKPVAKPAPAPQQAKKKSAKRDFAYDTKSLEDNVAKDSSLSLDALSDSDDSAGMIAPSRSRTGSLSGNKGSSAPSAAPQPMPEAEEEVAEKAEPKYRATNSSIDAVNQYFRQGDYPGAIRAADEFLSSNPNASNTEKATAMHIKAQSLFNDGKYSEADRLYRQIQANYPGYQSAAISQAREEIRSRNVKRKARPASPKKSADESVDYMFEDSN